jgi:hypothetical protein
MCSNERIILNLEAGGRAALNPRDIYSHFAELWRINGLVQRCAQNDPLSRINFGMGSPALSD